MAALLGDLAEPVEALCERATREAGEVVPANYNSPGQLVVSGEEAGVERVMELAKAAGAKRAVRLNVSGAFHSPLMAVAADGLRAALDAARVDASAFPVWSNVTAEPVLSPDEARALLLRQLTSPVRWTDQVRAMAAAHPDALWVEMGPGTVLGGLVKRIAPAVRTAPCGPARDIDQLLQQVA
jgi:[acyl-carrier-protein] S-malonyltransferase